MGFSILVALFYGLTVAGSVWTAAATSSVDVGTARRDCAIHADQGEQRRTAQLEAQLCATLVENIGHSLRKLKLEDFSWGIFGGTKGRLLGLRNYTLRARDVVDDDGRRLNAEYRLTVPALQATWEKSSCMGYSCAMTIELAGCEFAVRLSVDGGSECAVDHLAYLQRYEGARCHAAYDRSSPIGVAWVETTVQLLSYALNTKPFKKIVADNVNHALLRLPLFNRTDVRKLCDGYRLLRS